MLTVGTIGTRGIPNSHGGFERFVELLVDDPRWADDGVRFAVYGEGEDTPHNSWTALRSVGCTKKDRPFWYYFRSAYLASRECDVILCCGVALSIFAFWPGLRGKALIVNPDGCEWRRTKWSRLGRLIVWAMYAPAMLAAKRIVIDAEALRSDFRLSTEAWYIPYSAPEPKAAALTHATREAYALDRPYVLVVARLEPENNIGMIVEAFEALADPRCELVIIGGTTTPFYHSVLASRASPNIRFIGGIYDQEILDQVRSNATVYLHGHSVGGTNPSLLEALASVTGRLGCHDNKYNREVAGAESDYFADAEQLTELMRRHLAEPTPYTRRPTRDMRFHPNTIYERYKAVFRDADAAR
ncbi:glycosyltransferase [Brevundimonas sp. TWP2-3-4b2]|uniref:glycosyltransferase n=1 Tax=Brevundimonas sp. TWP2-3-4b2 TaxID=2804595 RepID=UPI003CEBDB6C